MFMITYEAGNNDDRKIMTMVKMMMMEVLGRSDS